MVCRRFSLAPSSSISVARNMLSPSASTRSLRFSAFGSTLTTSCTVAGSEKNRPLSLISTLSLADPTVPVSASNGAMSASDRMMFRATVLTSGSDTATDVPPFPVSSDWDGKPPVAERRCDGEGRLLLTFQNPADRLDEFFERRPSTPFRKGYFIGCGQIRLEIAAQACNDGGLA